MPQIRPITDLRNTTEISEICHAKKEPVFITKNGYGDLVVMSIEAYEVDDIHVELPEDTTYLQIEEGQDLCTLVTCTPFGINSHRLLVRGHRVPYEADVIEAEEQETIPVSESIWWKQYRKGVRIGVLFLSVPLAFALAGWWRNHKRGRKRGKHE